MGVPVRTVLYRLIFDALIEMRAEAHKCNTQMIFQLSDLLHTLPLSLERMERGEVSPEEVMQWLQTRARQKGLEPWLEHRIQEDSRHKPKGDSGSVS